ncbi:MAG TPA: ribonuclease activity regulator RraA [Streptosporangiaceae bacterium]|nr:ribonuclease activity regulator RraA [Streptosporangiaceae bacterium]
MDLSQQTLSALSRASTATLQTQLFARGLRNTFLFGLRPLDPRASRFVGEAFTLRYIPAREDIDVLETFSDPAHPQRRAIESVGPGQVLVMDCRGEGRAASAGHILTTRLQRRGAAALVTDGSVRDSPQMRQMSFPAFTAAVSATTNLVLHHAVDVQVPIGCSGVPVFPGDILVGDEEGVVVIPRHLAAEIAQPAAEQEELEGFILDRVRAGAALPGTYPPDETTLAAFRATRGGRSA